MPSPLLALGTEQTPPMHLQLPESRIQLAVEEAKSAPSYAYPWDDLSSHLQSRGETFFWLVGYGSLLSLGSAARTIDTTDKAGREPVYVYGARRQYSYRFPKAFLKKRYDKSGDFAALDSKATYQPDHGFNAIITRVFLNDLNAFREREFAYDLKPIPAFRWNAPEQPHRIAYTLDCPAILDKPDHPYTPTTPPLPEYHRICRDGAKEVSPEFLQCFLNTTFLGDGKTPISQWEKDTDFNAQGA